jgi:hypothetical protein
MSSSEDRRKTEVSRRRFLEWAGGFVLAGAFATNPGNLSALLEYLSEPGMALSPTDAQGAPGSQVPANSFSIFWITDTQFLSESNPDLFKKMTKWIVDNWGPYNGKMVIHTGDIVQIGSDQDEWVSADKAMSVLLANGIPYCWCAGNHDDMVNGDQASGWMGHVWSSAFNPSTVKNAVNQMGYARWAGDCHDGMNTAVSFQANGMDFLVANIEWRGDSSVLEWVRMLLDDPAYANHYVIVAAHAYINAFGSLHDPRWSEELDDFVAGLTPILDEHSSKVFLTLNGHFATDCGYNTPVMVNDRNQLMFDRQDSLDWSTTPLGRGFDESGSATSDIQKVGGATVTILTFDMVENQISVKTYDTFVDGWRGDSYEQYTIPMLFVESSRGHVVPLIARIS